jgi:hypothetical protein
MTNGIIDVKSIQNDVELKNLYINAVAIHVMAHFHSAVNTFDSIIDLLLIEALFDHETAVEIVKRVGENIICNFNHLTSPDRIRKIWSQNSERMWTDDIFTGLVDDVRVTLIFPLYCFQILADLYPHSKFGEIESRLRQVITPTKEEAPIFKVTSLVCRQLLDSDLSYGYSKRDCLKMVHFLDKTTRGADVKSICLRNAFPWLEELSGVAFEDLPVLIAYDRLVAEFREAVESGLDSLVLFNQKYQDLRLCDRYS